jgi:hypothetical protein
MPSREDLCIGGYFDLDQGGRRLWFGSQPVSLKHINSMPILALARIPVQMEFLVGTRACWFRNLLLAQGGAKSCAGFG